MEIEDFPYPERVKVVGDCWEWTGKGGYQDPYGSIRGEPAHRVIYAELVGPIPDGLLVDHRCHNTRCVRPNHLRPATHQENMQNRKGASKNNRTGVRNVMLTPSGTYQVRVSSNKKTFCLGTYATLEEADSVATEARQRLHID